VPWRNCCTQVFFWLSAPWRVWPVSFNLCYQLAISQSSEGLGLVYVSRTTNYSELAKYIVGVHSQYCKNSRPLWSFEHSGRMAFCACVDALASRCASHASGVSIHVIIRDYTHTMYLSKVVLIFFRLCKWEILELDFSSQVNKRFYSLPKQYNMRRFEALSCGLFLRTLNITVLYRLGTYSE
jgi:hypothetical protein